jgi:UDP-3-O-[3-hydroxymyristoyl] glucosamine N-acyltransferase
MTHEVLTLGAICANLQLTCPKGQEDQAITGVATLQEAGPEDLSFLSNPKYVDQANASKAGAIFVGEKVELTNTTATIVRAEDPYLSFALHLRFIEGKFSEAQGQHPSAIIDPKAQVHPTAIVEAGAIIEAGAVVGAHSLIGIGAKILHGCIVGEHTTIKAGAVIGSEGFGFAPDQQGHYHRIPQLGIVRIENNVSIGANTTVDRAALGETIIEEGAKIDNLCMIAHNVRIGAHTVMAAQTGIAGSTTVGKHCMIGGQVGIIGHLTIGDHVKIYAQTGVMHDVPSNRTIFGSPALEHRHFLKSFAAFKKQGE